MNSAVSGGLQRQQVLAGSHDELGVSIAIVVKVRVVADTPDRFDPAFLAHQVDHPMREGRTWMNTVGSYKRDPRLCG